MKKIEAIVRPEKVNPVIRTLDAAGHHGVTVYEVAGHGKQRGHAGDKGEVEVLLRPKVMLVVVVEDADAEKVIQIILDTAKTSLTGDGKIFVSDLTNVVRIRTGESGDPAI